MKNQPLWMYELYASPLKGTPKSRQQEAEWLEKPVAERGRIPLNFNWKDEPYLCLLDQNGLV